MSVKFTGRLIKGTRILKTATCENNMDESLHKAMENSLIALCRDLDISVPMWLKKNTNEFAIFRRTSFDSGQFNEQVGFERFELRMEGHSV